jgi:hypothetical protein
MNRAGYLWSIAVLWCATVGLGLLGLSIYATTPGEPARSGANWPAGSGIPFDCRRPNLLVFLHPCCPCSKATLAELDRTIAATDKRAAVSIVLVVPERMPEQWERGGICHAAKAIPGARILIDNGGVRARQFGAVTSGQVLLYAKSGQLIFQGGITGSRGHEGDNSGRANVIGAINGTGNSGRSAPVFGCKLYGGGRSLPAEPILDRCTTHTELDSNRSARTP